MEIRQMVEIANKAKQGDLTDKTLKALSEFQQALKTAQNNLPEDQGNDLVRKWKSYQDNLAKLLQFSRK
jgi:hypothetical protein